MDSKKGMEMEQSEAVRRAVEAVRRVCEEPCADSATESQRSHERVWPPESKASLPMPELVGPNTFRMSDGSVWRETITPTGWIMERLSLSPARRD